jgi:hypothetical protein
MSPSKTPSTNDIIQVNKELNLPYSFDVAPPARTGVSSNKVIFFQYGAYLESTLWDFPGSPPKLQPHEQV